jgi:hypothetical protein
MHVTASHYAAPARPRQPRLAPCSVPESARSGGWRVRLGTVVVALLTAALCIFDADAATSFANEDFRGR